MNSKILISLIIIISGILLGLVFNYLIYPLGWICYSGLFYIIIRYKPGLFTSFIIGFAAFLIQGLILFCWMGDVAVKYSGTYGITGYILSFVLSCVFAVKSALLLLLFRFFTIRFGFGNKHKKVLLLAGTASAAVVLDWIYSVLFLDIPWIRYFLGNTQATDLYAAQIAEVAGAWLLTFLLIISNLLFAYALNEKKWKIFYSAFLLIAIVHLYGAVRLAILGRQEKGKKFEIALVCDNTPPEARWNQNEVNSYVNTLFNLNKKAVASRPDLIIWNEGVIPWSYSKDDDFLKEIAAQTGDNQIDHLLSFYTINRKDTNTSFNSAYLFNNKGEIRDRYDKTILLGGLEKPLWDISRLQLPFFISGSGKRTINGQSVRPLSDEKAGKPGVFICNEAFPDDVTAKLASAGAGFLVLMANDNWFTHTQCALHFYSARLRAIETRKDVAVNMNLGISGVIDASGRIRSFSSDKEPLVIRSEIYCDFSKSHYNIRKYIFLSITLIILIITIILNHEKN